LKTIKKDYIKLLQSIFTFELDQDNLNNNMSMKSCSNSVASTPIKSKKDLWSFSPPTSVHNNKSNISSPCGNRSRHQSLLIEHANETNNLINKRLSLLSPSLKIYGGDKVFNFIIKQYISLIKTKVQLFLFLF
jgi:hypothetical protein